ncbi:MAG: hypothetical protein M3Y56_03525 [Armatimonadota bacterium]|nr:hypothetical protein [Armatimonadota bacterium]
MSQQSRPGGRPAPRRRSKTFGCATLGLVGAAILLYLLFRNLLLVSPQAIPISQAPTRAALTHAQQAAQQWRVAMRTTEAPAPNPAVPYAKARRATARPHGEKTAAPHKIVMQEADINTLIGANLASHPSPLIRSPRLHITPAAVIVSGYVPWQGAFAPLEVNALPVVRGGRIAFAVQSASLAGLPAPRFVRDLCQQRVDSLLKSQLGRLTGVRGVRLGDGVIEVEL